VPVGPVAFDLRMLRSAPRSQRSLETSCPHRDM
jgi:hypothetical protein